MKYEELFQLQIAVASKKTFLRYIRCVLLPLLPLSSLHYPPFLTPSVSPVQRTCSHELRTPLNSASLGVNWLISAIDDVEDKDEFDMELLETASDVSKVRPIYII